MTKYSYVYLQDVSCTTYLHFFIQFYNCPLPSCSRGARFDKRACKCFDDTDSFCPLGFYPARDKKRCFCEKRTKPRCPSGLSIYGRDCVCTGDPTCPDGSTLSYSKATCSAKPYCPDGADLIDCECVRRVDRICASGATLSRDGCDCKISYPPTCSKGCSLDSDRGCKCSIQKKQDKSKNCLWQKAHVNIILYVC